MVSTRIGEALLQLKALAGDPSSLQSWQAATAADPCGKASCALGACVWDRVACEQQQVTHV